MRSNGRGFARFSQQALVMYYDISSRVSFVELGQVESNTMLTTQENTISNTNYAY